MSEIQPSNTDAILGGQNPPPFNAAVLGGIVGLKLKIVHEWGLSEGLVDRFSFETVTVNERAEITDRKQKQAFCYTVDINGVPLEMVYIPAGSFLMGGYEWLPGGECKVELPIHLVTLQSFFIGKYPVTQKQYLALTDKKFAFYIGEDTHPVQEVPWRNAMKFCRKLSKLTNKNFTLPSESQWEYACRAGTNTPFYFGQKINTNLVNFLECKHYAESKHVDDLKHYEYVRNYYIGKTTPVGMYPPNSWGLYDLHGNVWEWCLDTFHLDYIGAPSDGSAWIDFDKSTWIDFDNDSNVEPYGLWVHQPHHQSRGGSWADLWYQCMSHKRAYSSSHRATNQNGFRVCMVLNSDDRYEI